MGFAPQRAVSAEKATRAQVGAEMLQDRRDGLSVREVAEKFGVARMTVYRYIDTAVRAVQEPAVEAYREMERVRLEECDENITQMIEAANELGRIASAREDVDGIERAFLLRDRAVNTRLRASDRWCKLMGLDAPVKVEASVVVQSQADVELAAILDRVK